MKYFKVIYLPNFEALPEWFIKNRGEQNARRIVNYQNIYKFICKSLVEYSYGIVNVTYIKFIKERRLWNIFKLWKNTTAKARSVITMIIDSEILWNDRIIWNSDCLEAWLSQAAKQWKHVENRFFCCNFHIWFLIIERKIILLFKINII